ncbi:hypothetical protein, partial [uncultured Megasphaera sp.]|uniref:hypothetical protein n=1 Tax=uncultured Megasphaera sp. TaxID=165188 RepID=UPI002658B260
MNIFSKQHRQQRELRVQAGMESGIDWMATLILQVLHDKYGFGRNRFAAMNEQWDKFNQEKEGIIFEWRDELEQNGFSRPKAERIVEKLEKKITDRSKDWAVKKKTRDMLMGALIVTIHTLYTDYGFRKKRIADVLGYISDCAYVIYKNDVTIWEFMECMHQECAIEYPVLEEYC